MIQRFSEVFRDVSEVFRGPLRDPLRDTLRSRFPSQRLSVLLALIVLPLELFPWPLVDADFFPGSKAPRDWSIWTSLKLIGGSFCTYSWSFFAYG